MTNQRVLVTGSSGHLGEALMHVLPSNGFEVIGLDVKDGPFTQHVGSITDVACVERAMDGVDAVLHTATLHKPHIATHTQQDFLDVNVTGTAILLETAQKKNVGTFIFTSTTSAFGRALRPSSEEPAIWITEKVQGLPKNIYGATKTAAEDLCALYHYQYGMACLVLRTSRFFPEEDDNAALRDAFDQENAKVVELLYRRVDIADIVDAHICALQRAPEIGFDRFIISATSPFVEEDLAFLRNNAAEIVGRYCNYQSVFDARGWRMFDAIDRVYVNKKARERLGWRPVFDFQSTLDRLQAGERPFSDLTYLVGSKGYHAEKFSDGPFPTKPERVG